MSNPVSRISGEVRESNRQAELVWEHMARHHPNGEIVRYPGATAAWCHGQWAFMNMIILSAPVGDDADLDRRLATAVEHGQNRSKPWMFCCCRDYLPNGSNPEVFERYGLVQAMSVTGMVSDNLKPPARGGSSLQFRPVADAETRRAVADINAVCYGVPNDWGRELFAVPEIWTSGNFGCVGYVGNIAVTTATTVILDGVRNVGLVATLPEHRQRGYAEAAMRHSLDMAHAATGIVRTVLHATPMGRPVYERMGYRPVTEFDVYAPSH
jgi:GNAT superfamily N-acetyltransferase